MGTKVLTASTKVPRCKY